MHFLYSLVIGERRLHLNCCSGVAGVDRVDSFNGADAADVGAGFSRSRPTTVGSVSRVTCRYRGTRPAKAGAYISCINPRDANNPAAVSTHQRHQLQTAIQMQLPFDAHQ
jgi:hypothetical protein